MSVVDITPLLKLNMEIRKKRQLDAQASYTAMETCLFILNMSSAAQLEDVKKKMKETMKEMIEINNGKKTK